MVNPPHSKGKINLKGKVPDFTKKSKINLALLNGNCHAISERDFGQNKLSQHFTQKAM
jgi:hypothetical protein